LKILRGLNIKFESFARQQYEQKILCGICATETYATGVLLNNEN